MNTDKWIEALYEANFRRVYRIAAYLLNDSLGHCEDALDMVQEVFLRASRSNIRDHPKPEAWLVVTTRKVCSNFVRGRMRAKRKLEKAGRALAKQNIHCVQAYEDPSGDDTGASDIRLTLEKVLTPDEYRLMYLYCIEERTAEEIAALMGISPGNVRVKIFRIREKVRKNIHEV